jgi:endo-alpha-1,4-polygalactosaminidase (GH114 family)
MAGQLQGEVLGPGVAGRHLRILGAGFDGVYLDIIDAFEYFEGLQ